MRVANVAGTLAAQINYATMKWIRLKIEALIEKYKEQLSTKRIYCDANDWFTVQVVNKLYEIGKIFGRSKNELTYLFKKEIILEVEIDIEREEICIEYSFTEEDGEDWEQIFTLDYFPHEDVVDFRYVDHKNLGKTLEKLKDKVEELLSLMEKKFQEVIQIKGEVLEQWRQSKIYTELLSEKASMEFGKKGDLKIGSF